MRGGGCVVDIIDYHLYKQSESGTGAEGEEGGGEWLFYLACL